MANIQVNLNEKPHQIDYKENLAVVFKAMEEITWDLEQETENELSEDLAMVDNMEQDVLHLIEFVNFNGAEGYTFSKMIQEIRIARRKIKDRFEERRALRNLITNYEKLGFKMQLSQVLGNFEGLDKKREKRTYRLRELHNLQGFNDLIEKQKEKLKEKIAV